LSGQSLAAAFSVALAREAEPSLDAETLEAELGVFVERGRAAHPAVTLDPVAFATHLGMHCRQPADLASIHAEDLYLACACAGNNQAALAELLVRLEAVADRTASPGDDADEIRLSVMQRLVVDDPPKIATYGGRGTLSQWLAAAMAREQISRRRTAARRRALLEDAATDLAPSDPELAFLKTHYRAEYVLRRARPSSFSHTKRKIKDDCF
jgi:RNA polymerase sigma-70 factor (ECF subfamily)